MAPKKEKMPSMKELQDLLAALDAEGGLAIGGGDESTNLDDLYEDSFLHAILHNKVTQETIEISSPQSKSSSQEDSQPKDSDHASSPSSSSKQSFDILSLPKDYFWGDDHESQGRKILVRPGYSTVLAALNSATSSQNQQSIFMATGPPGIGKSCLAFYLVSKFFAAGHDIVISDPMFTNAFINKQYYSCYSPHLAKHPIIYQAITTASTTTSPNKPTWWICDDGFLPIKGTKCQVLATSSTAQSEQDAETIHKKNKLPNPAKFQIPTWTFGEIKAGLIISVSDMGANISDSSITADQESMLENLYKKFKGNPRKILDWVKTNWVVTENENKPKSKSKSKSKSKPKKSSS